MWNPASSRRSPAFTELSSAIYRLHQPRAYFSCTQPTSLFRLMSIFHNSQSFSVACWKPCTANNVTSRYERTPTYFSLAGGTLLPRFAKAGPTSFRKFRRKVFPACSVQGTEPSSVGLQEYMECENCRSAQKGPPKANSGQGESEALYETATNMRPNSDAEAFKQNGREGACVLAQNVLKEDKSLSHGSAIEKDGTKCYQASSGVPNLQAWEDVQDEVPRQQPAKYQEELKVASRAVQLACMLTQRIQDRLLRHEESASAKNDHSLVTIADWGVQAVVSWVLSQAFPNERLSIVAEEDTENLRGMDGIHMLQRVVATVNECLSEASVVGVIPPEVPLATVDVLKAISRGNSQGGPKGRHWVLDPVDGTLGFVRGDQYAVALAMIEDGQVVLGLLGCPNFPMRRAWLKYEHKYYRLLSKMAPPSRSLWHKGCVMTAIKGGGGAWMEPLIWGPEDMNKFDNAAPLAIHVSNVTDPAEAAFCEPVEKGNSSHQFSAGVASSIGLRMRPLRIYSMAKYAAIARGDAEIFMKFAKVGYREKIWDHAAGVLIVEEAGGVVTDARGRPLDFSKGRYLEGLDRGIIASAGEVLHNKIIAAVDDSWSSSTL